MFLLNGANSDVCSGNLLLKNPGADSGGGVEFARVREASLVVCVAKYPGGES